MRSKSAARLWSEVAGRLEVSSEKCNRLVDDLRVCGGVRSQLCRDLGRTARRAADDVDEIERVLRLASIREGEGLQHYEGARPADGYFARGFFSGECGADDRDLGPLVERELEAACDERAEVGLEVLNAANGVLAGSWRHQEVDLQVTESPSLDRWVAGCVLVRLEALGAKSCADLSVALVVEHGERQPEVAVVGTRVVFVGVTGLAAPRVDQQARYEASNDDDVIEVGAQGDRHRQARRSDEFGLLARVTGAVAWLLIHGDSTGDGPREAGSRPPWRAPADGGGRGRSELGSRTGVHPLRLAPRRRRRCLGR